jgi:predicted  nucleic acid-binding Zn-ribbon protein
MSKFQVGQKVVPVSKSVWGQLNESTVWKEAQGQGFMFINGFDHEENAYVCGSENSELDGDFFLESDLIPYVENKFKVGDKVRRKDGECFSNGEYVVTVDRFGVTSYAGKPAVWLKETGTHIDQSSIELAEVKCKLSEIEVEACCELNQETLEELQQEAIVELEDKVLELEDKIVELEDKMGAGEYKFQEVLHELKETKEDCVELEQRNKQLREQRDRYCEELKKNDQELTILDGKVYDLRIDLENAHGLIEKLKEELKVANQEVARVGAERDRFRRDYDKERAKVFHMKKAMKEFIEVVEY